MRLKKKKKKCCQEWLGADEPWGYTQSTLGCYLAQLNLPLSFIEASKAGNQATQLCVLLVTNGSSCANSWASACFPLPAPQLPGGIMRHLGIITTALTPSRRFPLMSGDE